MELAEFWQTKNNKIRCQLCNHYCLISKNQTGFCGVRKNIDKKLYSLVYGKVIAENVDPIEKKPLYHFLPGSYCYSIATIGCNFKCLHCQNADISQYIKDNKIKDSNLMPGKNFIPVEIIENAQKYNCLSIAYTYTEPTIFAEFALDCMKLAHTKGLKNVWVSNGYTAKEAWVYILPHLDAINIDLKFFQDKIYQEICGAKLQPIVDNLKLLKKQNIWLELTTLLIPEINDSDDEISAMAKFVFNELGSNTPWHLTAFYPNYKLKNKNATSSQIIFKAIKIARQVGLKNVYSGNI